MARDRLERYRQKRDFSRTAEPAGRRKSAGGRKRLYAIQKHAARAEHYDVRLEHDGVLLSWAVPKGPSDNPQDKRLAVQVEDHPRDYGHFEGTIPKGEYGGGTVMLWDRGSWMPDGDVDEGLRRGKLTFELRGERLRGHWALVRLRPRPGERGRKNWLLIKEKDDEARSGKPVTARATTSVKTGRSMDQIAAAASRRASTARDKTSRDKASRGKKKTVRKKVARRPVKAGR